MKIRRSFWFVFAPVALLAFFSPATSSAQSIHGLNAVGYSITDIPPLKSDSEYVQCGAGIKTQINTVWEYDPLGECPTDSFMVHYTGFITIPEHQTVRFWLAADDGGMMKIGTTEWGDWTDKGCSASETEPLSLPSNEPISLDGWFYENGGGTCFMLAWQIDNGEWQIVPSEAFSPNRSIETTSTTVVPTTSTSTTLESTSTSTTIQLDTTTTTTFQSPISTTTTLTTSTTTSSSTTSTTSTSTTTSSTSTTVPAPTTTTPEITASQAAEIASDPDVLATLDPAEAEQVFESLELQTLSDEQLQAVIEAVQNAPVEIRAAFESAINIFDGKTDTYIPIGSNISIGTRRTVVVTTAFMIAMPPAPITGKNNL